MFDKKIVMNGADSAGPEGRIGDVTQGGTIPPMLAPISGDRLQLGLSFIVKE